MHAMVASLRASEASIQIIHLSGTASGSQEAAPNGSSCSGQLIQAICEGLMHPTVPLSAAAATKLELQQLNAEQLQATHLAAGVQPSNSKPRNLGSGVASSAPGHCTSNGSDCSNAAMNGSSNCVSNGSSDSVIDSTSAAIRHCSANCLNGTSSNTGSCSTAAMSGAPVLLKSLPVELLYDDTGLALFDSITYMPEYYPTAAEADILERCGRDIVERCVASHGAVLVELGAGSMRKTKLLLEAMLSCGRQGVRFCALDLCEASLSEALQQLQGVFQGSISLTGLVGTYEQGLAYISANNMQLVKAASASTAKGSNNTIAAAAGKEVCQGLGALAPAGPAAGQQSESESDNAWRPDRSCCEELLLPDGSSIDGSSIDGSSIDGSSIDGSSSLSSLSLTASLEPSCCEPDNPPTAAAAAAESLQERSPKVMMWLGSSIGNCTRDEATAFLKQLREVAMLPGDTLLVGIDRRNSPSKVAAAYNDAAGITRDFILNGLHHAKHLLDQQLQFNSSNGNAASHSSSDKTNDKACTNISYSGNGCDSRLGSLDPAAFEYFCLYNDELGRHEAYYQAVQDTQILLPAAAAAAAAVAAVASRDVRDAATGKQAADLDGIAAAAAAAPAAVAVPIAAGELLHIEFSHKYSMHEVMALADAAGLAWCTAWTDSQQQYDLHMFCLPAQ